MSIYVPLEGTAYEGESMDSAWRSLRAAMRRAEVVSHESNADELNVVRVNGTEQETVSTMYPDNRRK